MSQETQTGSVLGFALRIYFIYLFWLCWVFVAVHRFFSSCGKRQLLSSCGVRASRGGGFSCCGAWLIGTWASVFAARGFIVAAPEHVLSSCGT